MAEMNFVHVRTLLQRMNPPPPQAAREMRQAEEEDFDPRFHHASYVWLTLGWYREGWWTAEVVNDTLTPNCSSEDLAAFISRTVGIQQFPTADNDTTETDVQLVGSGCGYYTCTYMFMYMYSGTPLIRTPMGPIAIVLISGVSAFQGVKIYSSNGDTFRSFRAKCPLNRGVRISEVRISGVPL